MSKPANPELQRRILSLALEELEGKSPERINMRSLAGRAGVSATAIYYYYPSKEALFERIKFEAMDELDGRVAAAIEAKAREGTAASVRALMRSFVDWCLEKPQLARLLMEGLPPREELDEEAMRRYYALHFRARDLLAEAVAEGLIGPCDLDLEVSLAQAALWGLVGQFLSKRIHPRFWDSIDPLVDRLAAIFIAEKGERR